MLVGAPCLKYSLKVPTTGAQLRQQCRALFANVSQRQNDRMCHRDKLLER